MHWMSDKNIGIQISDRLLNSTEEKCAVLVGTEIEKMVAAASVMNKDLTVLFNPQVLCLYQLIYNVSTQYLIFYLYVCIFQRY